MNNVWKVHHYDIMVVWEVLWMKKKNKKIGVSFMRHESYGEQPKHTINANIKSKIWNILEVKECNFTYFQEILEEDI